MRFTSVFLLPWNFFLNVDSILPNASFNIINIIPVGVCVEISPINTHWCLWRNLPQCYNGIGDSLRIILCCFVADGCFSIMDHHQVHHLPSCDGIAYVSVHAPGCKSSVLFCCSCSFNIFTLGFFQGQTQDWSISS